MFKNFKAELARRGLTNKEFAKLINMSQQTFSNKFLGKTDFTLSEIKKIKEILGKDVQSNLTVEYLFFDEIDSK